MAKKKQKSYRKPTPVLTSDPTPPAEAGSGTWHATRETIESIVIAFVLAFLFRTFEAEAFVIPTGSMSPALQGQHKDVVCEECGYRFRTNASSEGEDRERFLAQLRSPNLGLATREMLQRKVLGTEVVLGVCPMCRQTMAMTTNLPPDVPDYIDTSKIEQEPSYPGDRILVNKYAYNDRDPDRWDVVVFKFPGNGEMNYIKRLVGLPNETIRVYQGDIYIRDDAAGGDFELERKPVAKVPYMLQPVHDTDYESGLLHQAGWPLRWESDGASGWEVEASVSGKQVSQEYRFNGSGKAGGELSWLRYRHYLPSDDDWRIAREFAETGDYSGISKEQWLEEIRPQLIHDFNSYNASQLRGGHGERRQIAPGILDMGWTIPERHFGMHWVSDLAVRCHVEIESAQGELVLDLVEAGQHFECRIDLTTGQAALSVVGDPQLTATLQTSINSAGSYELLFANVDDRLLLWVDGDLVSPAESAEGLAYDAEKLFASRENIYPRTSDEDPADIAPVGLGARAAKLTVHRLEVLRDIYYVATDSSADFADYPQTSLRLEDGTTIPRFQSLRQLFSDPEAWPRFGQRKQVEFTTADGQLFVMGDNSPASLDCRLWATASNRDSQPGGPYLDRRLLIGKAVCVFWPHSWGEFPIVNKLPGFPNFGDMRLVR